MIWTSIKFVKKSVKLHSVACQLLKKKVYVALLQVSMIHPKIYYSRIHYFPMRFTNNNKKLSPFLEKYLSTDFTQSLGIWRCTFFLYFPLHKRIISLRLKILLTIFLWVMYMPLTNTLTFLSCSSKIMKLTLRIQYISNGMSLMSMLYAYPLQPVPINQCSVVSISGVECTVKFQYCWLSFYIQNFMSAYE